MVDDAWLGTVRIARDAGNISSLFPPGITNLCDLPFTLHNAIRMALFFLKFEELLEKEQPPRKIWLDPDKLEAWWDEVKAAREDAADPNGMDTSGMDKNAYLDQFFTGTPTGATRGG